LPVGHRMLQPATRRFVESVYRAFELVRLRDADELTEDLGAIRRVEFLECGAQRIVTDAVEKRADHRRARGSIDAADRLSQQVGPSAAGTLQALNQFIDGNHLGRLLVHGWIQQDYPLGYKWPQAFGPVAVAPGFCDRLGVAACQRQRTAPWHGRASALGWTIKGWDVSSVGGPWLRLRQRLLFGGLATFAGK
jgi:hypothetical protein